MKKFWNWVRDEESGTRTLYLDGVIAEESWFDDDVTPKAFKADLNAGEGDIVIWLNSVETASQPARFTPCSWTTVGTSPSRLMGLQLRRRP